MKGFSEDWTETSPNLWELKKELEGRPKKGERLSQPETSFYLQ